MDINLNQVIDQVSKEKGIDLESPPGNTGAGDLAGREKGIWCRERDRSPIQSDQGVVELFQIIRLAETIEDPYNELTLEEAEEHGLDAEIGDELLFQIFYLSQDGEKARSKTNATVTSYS